MPRWEAPFSCACVEVTITLVPSGPRLLSPCCRGSAQMSRWMWSWPSPCSKHSPKQLRPLWSSLCAGKTLWGWETSSLCHALVLAPLLHCHQVHRLLRRVSLLFALWTCESCVWPAGSTTTPVTSSVIAGNGDKGSHFSLRCGQLTMSAEVTRLFNACLLQATLSAPLQLA